MFAQNPLNYTNVNSLLSSQNRVFQATSGNKIGVALSKGGAYANKPRYVVSYAQPTGTLQSKGFDTLHQAMADARSGNNSSVKSFYFTSYWDKDAWLAKWNGAPEGLGRKSPETTTSEPMPMPLPAPAPTPAPTPIDTPVEDNTDTETGDPSDDPNAQEDSTESGEDISTLSDTTELVNTKKEVRPAFFLLPLIAIAGIGYFTYAESKKK